MRSGADRIRVNGGRVLLVYAHPQPTSFTAALKNMAVEVLRRAEHTVEMSGLYAEGIVPGVDRYGSLTTAGSTPFRYQTEQRYVHNLYAFARDIAREPQRFLRIDLLVWLSLIWWGNIPATLKRRFDRALAYSFVYNDGNHYDTRFLSNKKGLLFLSTSGKRAFRPMGFMAKCIR